jgi:hypothetical protein
VVILLLKFARKSTAKKRDLKKKEKERKKTIAAEMILRAE